MIFSEKSSYFEDEQKIERKIKIKMKRNFDVVC